MFYFFILNIKIIYYLKSQPIYKHQTQWQLLPTNQQPPLQPPPTANQPPQTTTTITGSSNKFQIQKLQPKREKKINQPTK